MVEAHAAYRFEDQRYSHANEWGEHEYTIHTIVLHVYPIISYTKCGYWIGLDYSHYPTQPSPYKEDVWHCSGKRFVNLQANKKFALPTIAEAAESYRARKSRQISIYKARIYGAKRHLEALDTFLRYRVQPT